MSGESDSATRARGGHYRSSRKPASKRRARFLMVPRSLLEDADLSNDELAPIVRLLHHLDRYLHLMRGSPDTPMPLPKRLMVKVARRRADHHLRVFNRLLELRGIVPLLSDLKIISTSSGDDLDIISTSCGDDLKMAWPKAAKLLRSGVPTETETKTETRPNRSQSQEAACAPARALARASAAGASDVGFEDERTEAATASAALNSFTTRSGREKEKRSSHPRCLSASDADWVSEKIRQRFPQFSKDERKRWIRMAEDAIGANCNRHDAFRWIEREILDCRRLPAEERLH